MTLDEVFVGDPHAAAHNEERDVLNDITASLTALDSAVAAADLSAEQAEVIRVATVAVRDSAVAAANSASGSAVLAAASAELAQVVSDINTSDEVVAAILQLSNSLTNGVLSANAGADAFDRGNALIGYAKGVQRQVVPVTVSAINPQSSGVSLLETFLETLTYTGGVFATPGAVAHGLAPGDRVRFNNAAKTGMTFLTGATYFVRTVPTASSFTVATTSGGATSPNLGPDGTVPGYKNVPITQFAYLQSPQTVTIAAAGDTFTTPLPHFLAVGDAFTVVNSTAGGVTSNVTYYVKSVPTPTTFTASVLVRGTTLDVTSDGVGTLGQLNSLFSVLGWRPVPRSASAPTNSYVSPDPTVTTFAPGTATTGAISVSTMVDSDRFEALLFNDGAQEVYIFADGVLIDTVLPAELTAAGNGSGQTGSKLYTFPDSRLRTITYRTKGTFPGLKIPVTAKVSFFIDLNRGGRWLLVGDSYTEGTGNSGNYYSLAAWAQRGIGVRDFWQAGSGGSGYTKATTRQSLINRYVNDVINQAPDVVVLLMGLNDDRSNQNLINAAVTAATTIWNAVLATGAALIVFGPFSPRGIGTNSTDYRDVSLISLDQALSDAAEALGIRYVSPIKEGWITGNGRTGAPTGFGNADLYIGGSTGNDPTHPSPAGHEYFGKRLAGHLALMAPKY